jgi:hypothetical protein
LTPFRKLVRSRSAPANSRACPAHNKRLERYAADRGEVQARRFVPEEMKRLLSVIVLALAIIGPPGVAADQQTNGVWRKVLCFDVMAQERSHKADLGNHRRIVAGWDELGWDIEVLNYSSKGSENLLYDGNNWHGSQPWMVLAWTVHNSTYPVQREVSYDKGKSHLKIVLVDCQTKQRGSNSYAFVKGRVQVYHKP